MDKNKIKGIKNYQKKFEGLKIGIWKIWGAKILINPLSKVRSSLLK